MQAKDEHIQQASVIFPKHKFYKATKFLEQCDVINEKSMSEFAFLGAKILLYLTSFPSVIHNLIKGEAM